MNVTHVVWSFTRGGTECRLVDQFRHLSPSTRASLVIVNRLYDEALLAEIPARVTVHRVNRPVGGRSPLPLLALNRALQRLAPDVVCCHVASLAACIWAAPGRLVLHLHNTHEALGPLARRYERFYAISRAVAAHIREHVPRARPVVIYNGVETAAIQARTDWRADLFRIVQVGGFRGGIKGQDVLVNALPWLTQLRPACPWQLDFVGDGPSRPEIEGLARRLGLASRVRFPGAWPHELIRGRLRDYHALVLPSRSEGLGNAAIEALCAKVPAVVSRLPGPLEVIDEGRHGRHFAPGDARECAERLAEVYDAYGSGAVGQEVERACRFARERFDIAGMARRFEEEFGALCA